MPSTPSYYVKFLNQAASDVTKTFISKSKKKFSILTEKMTGYHNTDLNNTAEQVSSALLKEKLALLKIDCQCQSVK